MQEKEELIIEELTKTRKESSGFHLEIKAQDTTCDNYLLHVLRLRLPLHLAPLTLFNTLQQSLFAEQGSPFCLQVTGS